MYRSLKALNQQAVPVNATRYQHVPAMGGWGDKLTKHNHQLQGYSHDRGPKNVTKANKVNEHEGPDVFMEV